VNYPKNYRDLLSGYSAPSDCIQYLASIRWKNGFVCSRCGHADAWHSQRGLWICQGCEYQASVLAGTLFQDTKLPLSLWFQMIWWFMGQKSGASALSLQRNFGVGSYRTAWALLSKLRSCADQTNRQPLQGEIEVDEAFLGGRNNKEIIGIAAEVRGQGTGRIRLRHLQGRSVEEIHGFITGLIEPGSKIISDRHKSYPAIVKKGYEHEPRRKPYTWEEVSGDDERWLPRVHRVISLLKRWYYGTYHGRIDPKHLQTYLDEFVFRFNRRTSGNRGLVFHRLIEASIFPNQIKSST
jgi:hypothetical protein